MASWTAVPQSEEGIRYLVDLTVAVLVPEGGDGVQMIKAGLMEWADFFVVNKADRPGARQTASELKGWLKEQAKVILTQADRSQGIDEIKKTLLHWQNGHPGGQKEHLSLRVQAQILALAQERLKERIQSQWNQARPEFLEKILSHEKLLEDVLKDLLPHLSEHIDSF